MIAIIARIFETDVDDSSHWEQNISTNLHYACDLHTAAPSKCPMVVGKSACQHFLDILQNLANHNYQSREECMFKIDNTKHYINPITHSVRYNRINPFQVISYHDHSNDDYSNNNDEPFSLIRLHTRSFT
ncbi:hypothetical protein LOAG_04948 [Loa loa]|nr:hypothetical protein LOAG_04948 [Loa loa]EFO23533.1 hypothetical protein LOAG_04948 [Loa loa]